MAGRRTTRLASAAAILALGLAGAVAAQGPNLTLPPNGGNQRATVTQGIGLVKVSIDYSSPHVHSPSGEDRHGKIWGPGNLVPYGMVSLGFGTCGDQCPWRGGANENTVFTTNYDVKVQGQPLPAGSYGVHFLPGADEWTIIFSKNSTSWGSFSYDAKEDALRVKAKPARGPYYEDLTYGFRDRRLDHATAVLSWEDLEVPFTISVDSPELYVENLKRELRASAGFNWLGWTTAAQYCVQNKTHLEDGLRWAEKGADPAQGGEANFTSLSTLADLQAATGHEVESKKTRDWAFHQPTASALDLHLYARQLTAQKRTAEAIEVFQLNAKLHPNVWPVHVGLVRAYALQGKKKEALAEARLALPQAPDPGNRKALEEMIKKLEAGQDI